MCYKTGQLYLLLTGFTNPIIVLSASELDEDREKAIAVGCNDFVLKDMEMRGLQRVIDTFIAKAPCVGIAVAPRSE